MRRLVAAGVLFLSMACIGAGAAGANQVKADESAKAFMQRVSDTAIAELTDPGISDSTRVTRMRKMLDDFFDVPEIAKFVLGPYLRRTTPAEFKEFLKLYKIYVAHNYAGLFKRYNGQRAEALRERKLPGGETAVFGVIHQVAGPDIDMEMRVHKVGNTYKALDLKLEGISMPLTHRKQFAAVISRRGNRVAGLNRALKAATDRFEAETPSQ